MKAILPGVFHWKTFHEGIQQYVHSYYLEATSPAVLIDPRVPSEGLHWFERHRVPTHIYLTNRHHYRHSDRFKEAFGCTIWCHKAGLHEFTGSQEVKGFDHGEELPGKVKALRVGELCPEETALRLPVCGGIMALGDAIVRDSRGRLAFVPDFLMGDNPEAVKRGLITVFQGHLRRTFDHLLFAHGRPVIGDAKGTLRRFLQRMIESSS